MNKTDKDLLSRFTLLYVEDQEDTRETLVDILELYFKKIYVASDGKEGLDIYKSYDIDIVLSDVQMPIMNGIEMSQEIKKINPDAQIALFTAFNEPEFLKQAVNIGISKYILKPLDEKQFFYSLISMAKILQIDLDRENEKRLLEVQSKTAAMGEMIGNIAHQWRQPLSVISTSASIILLNKDLGEDIGDEKEREILEDIVSQTQFLSQTIDDFRDFFKDTPSSLKEFDIKEAIDKVIDLTKDSFKSNFIDIVEDISSLVIHQNQNQLTQALLNIFNNAKDAFVINNIDDKRYFFINSKVENNNIVMSFSDNAGGIKDDIIDRVFEPYFTTKHQYSGTGIGLYMTHKIICKHFNGTIKVENKEYTYDGKKYKGVSFCISFPIELENAK